MTSGSRSVYHSKAFPFKLWTNCLTSWSPLDLAFSHVSTKWTMCCFGLPFLSNFWNFGGWYPSSILKLSILLVYNLELRVHERSLRWAFILSYDGFVIISCNCWIERKAREVDYCCGWFSCTTFFPLSPALTTEVWLDLAVSWVCIYSFKVVISWSRSSTTFIWRLIFLSISAIVASTVTSTIMTDITLGFASFFDLLEAELESLHK